MRSMWKGAISFGLVTIPVKLYTATEQKDIAFRQVHREDGGRIRFRRFCTIDGNEVEYSDIAKGYELSDGEMVVLSDDDMADLPLPSLRSIEVLNFCPADQLDPILFNRTYYAEPDGPGTRAYVLLREALEQSDRIAIAKVALRQRESLATLRCREGVLVLQTLLWPDEVRTAAFGFLDEHVEVRQQELKMATSLIDSMTVDFDPTEYRDAYREALQEVINAKVEGREVQPAAFGAIPAPVDLTDALRASLEAARKGGDSVAAGHGPGRAKAEPGADGESVGAKRRARVKESPAKADDAAASEGESVRHTGRRAS